MSNRILGEGAHGYVILSHQPDGTPVAVKNITLLSQRGVARVKNREVECLQRLNHPNVSIDSQMILFNLTIFLIR